MATGKVKKLEDWSNQASKKVLKSGLKKAGKGVLYSFRNPWVWIVTIAWSALPEDAQQWVMDRVEQGLDMTFDSFDDFFTWMESDEESTKIVASYINQAKSSPLGILENAPEGLVSQLPAKDTEALAMLWRKRNAGGSMLPAAAARQNPAETMKLSEHHIKENGRTVTVKRMQSMFNVHGVLGTRQLQKDLRTFLDMSEDELDGAISMLLVVR